MNLRVALPLAILAAASAAQAQVLVYDNLDAPSAASAATSSTDLTQIWGDSVTLAQGGLLDSMRMTMFNSTNSGLNTNAVLTATIRVNVYDNTVPYTTGDLQATLPVLGTFDANIDFGAGLNPGFYSVLTVTGLQAFNITLPENIFITQEVVASTGGSTRLGVVTFTNDNVGTGSAASFYRQQNAPTFAEGLVAFTPPTSSNLGYSVSIANPVPEPGTMAVLGLGLAAAARRRKKNS